jgi:putative ABC transport system permease protein
MLKNYMKIALRNLLKYKAYSFINIMGLAIGVASCILILLFVQDELSYDRFHEKADRIYRVALLGSLGNNQFNGAVTAPPLGEALVRNYPEVESATRIRNYGFPVIRYGDKVFSEERFFWADSTFFEVFSFEFIKGDKYSALKEINTVVITESIAKKYFGGEDPVGKLLNSDNRRDYKISGVIKDFPENSHMHFDFIAALGSYPDSRSDQWFNNSFYTYIVLREGSDYKELEQKLDRFVADHVGPQTEQVLGVPFEDLIKSGAVYRYYLQPLTDIHLKSDIEAELEPNSSLAYVYAFSLIAVLILFIACINFMNLATARSSNRAKEIGIRKTLGSGKIQLVRQFLVETILMAFIAVLIAVIIVELLLNPFNNLIGKELSINYAKNLIFIPFLLLLALVVGVFAGIYPAFYLSSFDPIKVFRKKNVQSNKNSSLRNSLVVTQFAISIILFIGTIVIYNQVDFIQSKKLGFNKEQILVVQKTDDIGVQIESFKDELRNLPGVVSVSNSFTLFGKQFNSSAIRIPGQTSEESHLIWNTGADYDFAETYGIEIIKGRYYSPEYATDSLAVVLNETAVKSLGLGNDPLGKMIYFPGPVTVGAPVIGIMKDIHFESLQQAIKPMAIFLMPEGAFGRYVSVRLTPGKFGEKITKIKDIWHKFAGAQAFEYFFFDDDFAKLYESEKRTGVIAIVFAILAIFIACMGLLGLSSFSTAQRTKEIGIRKVMGASVGSIVILLSKEFIKWVLIANIIAWPLAYFLMKKWLENYAYRIEIEITPFIIAAIFSALIAIITISFQAFKAAVANPVNSLKYE